MIRWVCTLTLLTIFVAGHILSLAKSTNQYAVLPLAKNQLVALPPSLLKVTALEFDGLAADYMLLKAMVFIGESSKRSEKPQVKDWEWKWLYKLLDAASSLDPYFLDVYYFANAHLTWGGNLITETNTLMDKGIKARPEEWMLSFFAGFNSFYFLQDNDSASKYLMDASRGENAPQGIARLATSLAYKGKSTEIAIIFLKQMLFKTVDFKIRQGYETRLSALESIFSIEKAMNAYQLKFGERPEKLSLLVEHGLLDKLPPDPYGGSFYIDEEGDVKTTSNLRKISKPLLNYDYLGQGFKF